jgi:hypothetical protein
MRRGIAGPSGAQPFRWKPKMIHAGTERTARHVESLWRRISRRARWTILVLVVILVAARLALPWAIKSYVNKQLRKLPDYSGSVRDIDVALWRGAYEIRDIAIVQTAGNAPVPFFSSPDIDLSLQWGELFQGAIVGRIHIEKPEVNFVSGPGQAQTGTNQPWEKTFESLFPVQINQLEIDNGTVRFRNFQKSFPVNIFATNLSLVATNLSNARNQPGKLPAGATASGSSLGGGHFELALRLNPMAPAPTFELNALLTNVDLTALNDFLRSYGKFDVERGRFSLFTSVAAADGKYDGFIKVLFQNLGVFSWEKEHRKNMLEIFWQGIVGALVEGFKNHPHDQLATRIPITGSYSDPHLGILSAIGNLMKNAFVRALLPDIGKPVHVEDAEKKAEPSPPAVSTTRH